MPSAKLLSVSDVLFEQLKEMREGTPFHPSRRDAIKKWGLNPEIRECVGDSVDDLNELRVGFLEANHGGVQSFQG